MTQEKREKMLIPEQFDEWLEDPVTEIFLKYLKDSIKEESETVADIIASGGTLDEKEQIRKGTICVTLESISEITLEEILEFYKEEE